MSQPAHHAENRRTYAHIYLVAYTSAPFALCDRVDGHLLAFTDWDQAIKAGGPRGGFVTNWEQFCRRGMLALLDPKPAAMRIFALKAGSTRKFHAELDASGEEMRNLTAFVPWEEERRPAYVRALKAKAKVWEELT